jgi:hypothetical protein
VAIGVLHAIPGTQAVAVFDRISGALIPTIPGLRLPGIRLGCLDADPVQEHGV